MMPRLAILIPSFNCRDTIPETLRSLDNISEGWDQISSVVVCDDSSTDDTANFVASTKWSHFEVKLLRHDQNQGEGRCYATMVQTLPADVEWFLILHSDDLALPNFLKRNFEIAKSCDEHVAAVSSNYVVFGNGVERLAHEPAEDVIIWRSDKPEDIEHTAVVGTWWHVSGSLIRRSAWIEQGGRDTTLPQLGDWDLMLRWQQAGLLLGHSLLPTTKYRLGSTSVSSVSHLKFRDIQERAEVISRHPLVFTPLRRRRIALSQAVAGLKRATKLVFQGQPRLALNGVRVSMAAVRKIIFHTRDAAR